MSDVSQMWAQIGLPASQLHRPSEQEVRTMMDAVAVELERGVAG